MRNDDEGSQDALNFEQLARMVPVISDRVDKGVGA